MDREAIYAALFAKVKAAANFALVDRKLYPMAEVPLDQRPALFQLQFSETIEKKKGFPAKYTIKLKLWIYGTVANSGEYPSTAINVLLDLVTAALAPGADEIQNLGLPNVVNDCRIEGEIEIYEGVLGTTCEAIVPVTIIATSIN